MTHSTEPAVRILAASFGLGILADALLREGPWGLNFALWVVAGCVLLLFLGRYRDPTLTRRLRWMILPVALSLVGAVCRDSPPLKLLDIFALGVTFSLALLMAQGGSIRRSGIVQYLSGALISGMDALVSPLILLVRDVGWDEVGWNTRSARTIAALRGLLMSIPLLVVFGALFAGADAVFGEMIKKVLHINIPLLLSHLLMILFFAWIVAGYFRGMVLGKEREWAQAIRLPPIALGAVEIAVVMALLDLLFFSFIIIQIRYLFGGASVVAVVPGLTYAEYARRGFFELIAVAALVVPLLLFLHWSLECGGASSPKLFRGLAGVQMLFLFVVMASAFQRLRLYQQSYGLTEQRFYAAAFLVWLSAILIWFAFTVLRGYRQRFIFGVYVSGMAVVFALHAINPDARIVQINMAHAAQGHAFDSKYAMRLSADAVPAILHGLPSLPPEDQAEIANRLWQRWGTHGKGSWRTWTWGRARAFRACTEVKIP